MMYVPDEIWKPVVGYEGVYAVSNIGRVKGVKRKYSYKDGFRTRQEQILKPCIMQGYEFVTLQRDKRRKGIGIHRLVASAFIPNPQKLPQVNHKDGNRSNNNVGNLEWCTSKENMVHSVDNYIRTDLKPVDMYSLDGDFIKTFPSTHRASNETGIIRHNIANCCKNRYGFRTAGGYIWKYHERSKINA